jgi:hypothetical protein
LGEIRGGRLATDPTGSAMIDERPKIAALRDD